MEDALDKISRWLANPIALKIIELSISIVLLIVIVRVLTRVLSRQIPDSDLRYRVRKVIGLVGYGIIIFLVILVFSDSLGRLTVIIGAISAGIALALQEVIVSFAGWVAISVGQYYKPGDRVQLGGIMGDVIDISLLRTTLMECGNWVKADLYNGRIVRVANSFVFKEPVFNYSGDFPFLWDEITIPIRYGSDYKLAKTLLQQSVDEITGSYATLAKTQWHRMVRKYLIEDARIDPAVTLIANDNWLEFTVRYVVDYKQRRVTKDQLFMSILEALDTTNGRVQLASMTVELVSASELNVTLES